MKPRHWSRIETMHEQAAALMDAGEYEQALGVSEKALQFAFRHGGREDPATAACFFQLGQLQERFGDLTAAEPSYNAACSILNPTEGEATPLKAEVLLSYGSLYLKMGLGWRALLLLEHAKARFVELGGPGNENVGRCLCMIAASYETTKMEDEALSAYDEAIRILGTAWGPDHATVAYVEWSRADLVFWRAIKAGDKRAVDDALATFRVGLDRLEADAGRDHPETAHRRASLGTYLVVSDRFEEGAGLLADAVAILDGAGENVAAFCRQLATARARLGEPAEALALLRRSIRDDPIGHWVAHGSDRERMDALERVHASLAQYLDLVLLAGSHDPVIAGEACSLVLGRKALGAELLATQRREASRRDDPELTALTERLAELRARSAQSSLAGDEPDETRLEIERTEWELASRIPEMNLDPDVTGFTHEAAAALLPQDSVLVEFVRFVRRTTVLADPDARDDGSRDWYIAFVIPSAGGGAPTLVDLGGAPELDALIAGFRSTTARPDTHPENPAARDFIGSMDDDAGDTSDALRTRLVEPLLSAIGPRTRVIVAPDGDLSRVPFEALTDASGNYLFDRLDLSYVSTGRDLKRLASVRAAESGRPVVLADPDYDLQDWRSPHADAPAPSPSSGAPTDESGSALDVGAGVSHDDRRQLGDALSRSGLRFGRLPGTRAEGIAVAHLLGVEPRLGADAREEYLKAARSPVVLHVATHGFFLPAPSPADVAQTGSAGGRVSRAARNPLVRSGIVLAGSNAWLRGDVLPAGIQDGIVNGEDILAMDLEGTELVVLSACETGLGDVVAGEGVMGLRRAFAVAGVRTLVLSLWKVPDEQTRMLMTFFYEALIAGTARSESLREAQRRVRAAFPAPFYWAGFICQGDPEPIVASGNRTGWRT